jgi:hypothetical protein
MAISRKLLERLPHGPRARLHKLDEQVEDSRAQYVSLSERLSNLGKIIRWNEDASAQVTADEKTPEKEKPALLDGFREKLRELNDDYGNIDARRGVAATTLQRLDMLLQSITNWLEALPADVALAEDVHGDKSKIIRDAVTPDALEKRRRRIRELLADLRQADAAPYPASEAKQRAREELKQLAERGRPNVFPLIEQRQAIRWPELPQTRYDVATNKDRVTDTVAMFAWLHRDVLMTAIEREIDESAGDAQALTDAQRAERFKILLGDLLTTEREEEELIQAAAFHVDRRADADPRAVLGLSSALPGPARELVHRQLVKFVDDLPPAGGKSQSEEPDGRGITAPLRFQVPRSV